ncbi:hypothetical protein LJK87_49260 [Paenibacillus sp. P25]|nr:hypothetical protein LJK87_49260 [Paenibacillus sp. P25]
MSGWNFDRDGAVRLSGEWSFYWNRLLPPEAFTLPDPPRPSLYAPVPASWNGLMVDGKPISGEGYATYRIKLALPKLDKPLAIRIPTINTSYKLWMNGTVIASAGTVGVTPKESEPQYAPQLAFLHARGTEVDLVLQVSNYSHYKGGVWRPLEIGPMDSFLLEKELAVGFDTSLIGSLLIMGLYHLAQFAVRNKEWPMLFFGLFCLLVSLRMSPLGEIVLTKLFPDFDWTLAINLEYATAALGMSLFVLFFSGWFPQESRRKMNFMICIAGGWCAAVMAMLPTVIMTRPLVLLQLYLLGGTMYILWIVARAFLRQREGATILLPACLIFAASVLNDMLYAHELVHTTDKMTAFGLLVFIFCQTLLLSVRQSKAFSSEERLSAELTKMNSGLYDKIKEHTADLEAANAALKRKNDELSRLETSRSHLLSNISHDLGTPLTTIRRYVEAILDDMVETKEQRDRYLRLIHSKVLGMDRLIEDLFHLSQLEARQIVFKKHPFHTDRLIEPLYARYEVDTRSAGIRYTLTVHDPPGWRAIRWWKWIWNGCIRSSPI